MNDNVWRGMLIASGIMMLLLALSVPFVEQNSATFVVLVLAAVHLVAAMAILSALLYLDWNPFEPFRQ
jgi:anti-sigma-K factor RskA